MDDREHQEDDDLDALERMLPREMPPPASLEQRTVAALRSHGMLHEPPRRLFGRRLAAVAAAAVLFVSGAAANGYWNFLGSRGDASGDEAPITEKRPAADPCARPDGRPPADADPCTVIWF